MGDREGTAQAGLGTLGSPQTLLEWQQCPQPGLGTSAQAELCVCPGAPFQQGRSHSAPQSQLSHPWPLLLLSPPLCCLPFLHPLQSS